MMSASEIGNGRVGELGCVMAFYGPSTGIYVPAYGEWMTVFFRLVGRTGVV